MTGTAKITLLIVGILLLPLAFFTYICPSIFNKEDGEIEVNWANPAGIRLNGLSRGDRLDMEYRADVNVSLYLLRSEQADEYRAPIFDKDPLPPPLSQGRTGEVVIRVEEDGDYELLFLAEDPAREFNVGYDIEKHLKKVSLVHVISSMGLLLTSVIFTVLAFILGRDRGNRGHL